MITTVLVGAASIDAVRPFMGRWFVWGRTNLTVLIVLRNEAVSSGPIGTHGGVSLNVRSAHFAACIQLVIQQYNFTD
jgi:hypothetical protein